MTQVSSLPTISGMLFGHVGNAIEVMDVDENITLSRFEVILTDTSASPVTVQLSDGTTTTSITLPATEQYATVNVSDAYPLGSTLSMTITAAQMDAMNLSGRFWWDSDTPAVPGPSDGLVTLEQVKAALGLSGTTAGEDAYLQRQIDVISAQIREYTDRWILEREYLAEYLWTPYGYAGYPAAERPDVLKSILLNEAPVSAIDHVTAGLNTLDTDGYQLEADTGQIWRKQTNRLHTWMGYDRLEVQYTGGYTETPIAMQELIYMGISRKFSRYSEGNQLPVEQGPVAREAWTDVGSIDYAVGTTTHQYQADYLLGFPRSELAQWCAPQAFANVILPTFFATVVTP